MAPYRRQEPAPLRPQDRAGPGPTHIVSTFSAGRRLVLGQVKTAEKANEITAIPKLLGMMDIQGVTLTLDAMGCQRDIAEIISPRRPITLWR